MTIQTILYIYFWTNSLVFSYCLGADIVADWEYRGSKHVIEVILLSIVLLSFGSLMTLYDWMRQGIVYLFEKVNNIFLIKFFFQFFFTKKFNWLNNDQMEKVNNSLVAHQTNSIRDKFWRYAIKLINKRNKIDNHE